MPPSKQIKAASTAIIIVERNGELRPCEIKECTQLELSKKCKLKTPSGFEMRAEWAYSAPDADKFIVELWAREDGNAGQENKYEFPPPVDTILFFGACALVAKDMTPEHTVIPLTLEKWETMYNFLFGGFDTLASYDDEDEYEVDELDSIPASRKTKDGYLKDGFVVDGDEDSDGDETSDGDESDEAEDETDYDGEDASTDDHTDTDEDCDEPDSKKCTTIKHASNKSVVSKKRSIKTTKDEIAIPSFELVEETYEYPDD